MIFDLSIHFCSVDTLINKSLKIILMVLPNIAKKLYDAKLVAHTNHVNLVSKFRLGNDL